MTNKQIIEYIKSKIFILNLKREDVKNYAVKRVDIDARIDELKNLLSFIKRGK